MVERRVHILCGAICIIAAPANKIRIAAAMGSEGQPLLPIDGFAAYERAGGIWENIRKGDLKEFAGTAVITAEFWR